MPFERNAAQHWHRDVPGARWFKADLHIHTIDDFRGGKAKLPAGIDGPPDSEKAIKAYARRYLKSAIEKQVRVLGVTPHSPRVAAGADVSAAWQIVQEWNSGHDDDGVPFRNKIYAVFPGFEPSLKQGKSGLHLLFLFDPEIGRADFLRVFDLVMGATQFPWKENQLQLSSRDADEVFQEIRAYHASARVSTDGTPRWNYLSLAPHIDGDKGLLDAQKGQVLQLFQHGEIAGLELPDNKLPRDVVNERKWLQRGMREHRQAFFHGSDAYSVGDIGRRHTWLKLASPRIEALRQAFIASDSRMRICYKRNATGVLVEIAAPDVTVNERPWLKSVTVKGRASFFGGDVDVESVRFDLSPDLTCIIGGSMTGKSTLLDGLRMLTGARLPQDEGIKRQVEARGRYRFLAGSPEITLECPGRDPTAPPHEQWPAWFHAQNELQRLAQEPQAVGEILALLVASEAPDITTREERLSALDREIREAAKRLAKLGEDVADAEQAFERCKSAAEALNSFADAGVGDLHRVSSDLRDWQNATQAVTELSASLAGVLQTAESLDVPFNDTGTLSVILREYDVDIADLTFQARIERFIAQTRTASEELAETRAMAGSVLAALSDHEGNVRTDVERKLAERGVDGAKIKEFQVLTRQAALLASYETNLNDARAKLAAGEHLFQTLLAERSDLVSMQREAFDRVIDTICDEFRGRIAARRIDDGNREPLDRFLRGLNQRGVTRWWNDLADQQRPSPQKLLGQLIAGKLASVGMSAAVQATFSGSVGRQKRRELAAVRCRDRYVLELKMSDGSMRRLDDLSGGQRVSVLLSLLLETNDDKPLVIDQPEDELDNRFLFDTVLPALKRLKGRRQIIVATHNANIVVNGDADQVIQLEATANRGRVAQSGAIEEPAVRDAIVRTVDGGDEAFRLRRLKYGF